MLQVQVQQTRDDEIPSIEMIMDTNNNCGSDAATIIAEHPKSLIRTPYCKPAKEVVKNVVVRQRREERQHVPSPGSTIRNEMRDSPLTFMSPSSSFYSSTQESLLEEFMTGNNDTLLSPILSPSFLPSSSLVEDPSWNNLYYIQNDATFDDFVQVGEVTSTCCNVVGGGCDVERRNNNVAAAADNSNCQSIIDNAIYCNDNGRTNYHSHCLMTVDESPSVEPLSCREKIMQPALGCDEVAVERCIDFTSCDCYCAEYNNSSDTNKSSNSSRRKNNDEEDSDGTDENDITTFIGMIKMIVTTRWSDIYDELLLQ